MRSHTAIAALGLSVALIAGCRTDKAPVPDTASDAGAKVARRIVSGTLQDAIGATREALTRGGITLTDFAGTVEAPAGAPSPYFVPGQQLMAIVAAWVKDAQAAPTDL